MLAEKCKIQKENTKNLCWPTNVYKTHTVDKSATPSVRFLSNRPYKHRRYHYHHHRFHFSSLFRLHFSPDERSVFFFFLFHFISRTPKKKMIQIMVRRGMSKNFCVQQLQCYEQWWHCRFWFGEAKWDKKKNRSHDDS